MSQSQQDTTERSHWPLSLLSIAGSLLNVFLPLVLVRILAPEEIGLFKAFFLYLMLTPELFLAGGIINGIAYFGGAQGKSGRALPTSGTVLLLLGGLAAVGMYAFAPYLSALLGWNLVVTRLFALAVFGSLTAQYFEETLISEGRVLYGSLYISVAEFLRTFSMVVSAVVFRTVEAVLITHVALITAKSILGFLLAIRNGSFRISVVELKKVLKYGVPVALAGVSTIFINYADQLILAQQLDAGVFAVYALGCLALPPLFVFEHSVTRVAVPQLAEKIATNQMRQAARIYRKMVEQLALILIPATVGLMIFARPIIELLFTSKYLEAASYLSIFALSYAVMVLPADIFARAKGDSGWILRTTVVFGIIGILSTLCGALWFGVWGALITALVAKLAYRLYGTFYAVSRSAEPVSRMIPFENLSRYTMLSICAALVCLFMQSVLGSGILWLLVMGSAFWVIYLAGWLLFKPRLNTEFMNILMVVPSLQVGGLEKVAVELCRSISKRTNASVQLIAFDSWNSEGAGPLASRCIESGIPVTSIHKGDGFSWRVVHQIVRMIVDQQVRVVHTHDLGSLIYGGIAKIFSPHRISLVHTQHSFVHLAREGRYKMYERIFATVADSIVVVSEELIPQYRKLGVSAKNITVIPNGVVVGEYADYSRQEARDKLLLECAPQHRKQLEAICSKKWILFLARLHPVKGQQQALEIWEQLSAERRADLALVFVGPESFKGELKRLLAIKDSLPDCQQVAFVGASNRPELWMRASDCFLSCSEFEGHPLAPLEAANCKLPLLLSDIKGHKFLSDIAKIYGSSEEAAQFIEQLENVTAPLELPESSSFVTTAHRYYQLYFKNKGRASFRPFELMPRFASREA